MLITTVEMGVSVVLVAVEVTVGMVNVEDEEQDSEGVQTEIAELEFRDREEVFRFFSGT